MEETIKDKAIRVIQVCNNRNRRRADAGIFEDPQGVDLEDAIAFEAAMVGLGEVCGVTYDKGEPREQQS